MIKVKKVLHQRKQYYQLRTSRTGLRTKENKSRTVHNALRTNNIVTTASDSQR